MKKDDLIALARSHRQMPDWVWYQLNGKSLQENYNDQHRKLSEHYRKQRENNQKSEDPIEDLPQITFSSEVKIK